MSIGVGCYYYTTPQHHHHVWHSENEATRMKKAMGCKLYSHQCVGLSVACAFYSGPTLYIGTGSLRFVAISTSILHAIKDY